MRFQSEIRGRLFIVGVPRSGTTLLQSMLSAHPEVCSFTESHFFSRLFHRSRVLRRYSLRMDLTPRVREFLAENRLPDGEFQQLLRAMEVTGLSMNAAVDLLMGVLDLAAGIRESAIWVEKTPRHLQRIPLIEKVSSGPRPKFVHIVRRGPETVASLYRASQQWGSGHSLGQCVARWNSDIEITHRRLSAGKDEIVFYEDLVRNPRSTLLRILDVLDLEWRDELLSEYARTSESLVTEAENWKRSVSQPISARATSLGSLTPDELELINSNLSVSAYDTLHARFGLSVPPEGPEDLDL